MFLYFKKTKMLCPVDGCKNHIELQSDETECKRAACPDESHVEINYKHV